MIVEQKAEEYRKDIKSKFFLSEPQLDLACQGYKDGYHECEKEHEWHDLEKDLNDYPTKEQLGESFIVAFAFNKNTQKYYSFDCAEYIEKRMFLTHTINGSNENNGYKVIAWKEIE